MAAEIVNVDNFARAETDRMFAALQHQAGGVNVLLHHREPASLEEQPVIRQNRDTLYSSAIVDLAGGAALTLPDAGDRYLSVMVVNRGSLHQPDLPRIRGAPADGRGVRHRLCVGGRQDPG